MHGPARAVADNLGFKGTEFIQGETDDAPFLLFRRACSRFFTVVGFEQMAADLSISESNAGRSRHILADLGIGDFHWASHIMYATHFYSMNMIALPDAFRITWR